MSQYSVVEYFGQDDGHSCGYCKGKSTSFTHGMWSHVLSNRDYQDLIDRGWRRSGKYVYKPVMDRTCCPQYTIRCDVDQFRPTRSHKKILKKFRKFVIYGQKERDGKEIKDDKEEVATTAKRQEEEEPDSEMVLEDEMLQAAESKTKMKTTEQVLQKDPHSSDSSGKSKKAKEGSSKVVDVGEVNKAPRPKEVKPGIGANPDKPRARKAKELRRERALQKKSRKLESKSREIPESKVPENREKILSDFLDEPFPDGSAHHFEIRTVWAQRRNPKFMETFAESLKVYQRYQMQIHGDQLSKVTAEQFTRFLCDAPLLSEDREGSGGTCPDRNGRWMGGFHQQYLLDGRIFCVGVVDILPDCLSSVYLFYDPDFSFLSPGTLSSLFELHFTRRAALSYYYMGFYIHDCPKMRYKAQYVGSHLLCPERYTWVPVEHCWPTLDKSKYARLSADDVDGRDDGDDDMSNAMILHQHTAMPYSIYRQMRDSGRNHVEDDKEIREYRRLVGASTTARMLLFRE